MKKILALALVLVMLSATSCTLLKKEVKTKENPVKTPENTSKEVVLYYSNKDASGLFADKIVVPADKADDALFIAEELLKGPQNEELINVIPEGTKVNSCVVSDGLCTLDLSREFISKQGTANEQMAIYSVVNTLCALDSVDEVEFLIDGESVMIFGSYIFDEPFSADDTMIR